MRWSRNTNNIGYGISRNGIEEEVMTLRDTYTHRHHERYDFTTFIDNDIIDGLRVRE